ncbi:MAG: bestrophin family ion channel [Zymomonas mobilis]|uniref:Putative membrane protein n=1 Tax=Zymomonas mobilis TaxID=542 RepID=A0A542W1G1_ZYMMB|nr:putative membrane protein [Zymomonas mobilis]
MSPIRGRISRTKDVFSYVGVSLWILLAWDILVTALYVYNPEWPLWMEVPTAPTTVLGSALILFIGFSTNSAYARWWDARGLWGLMNNNSRNFSREVLMVFRDKEQQKQLVHRHIAYIHALRCRLFQIDPSKDIERFLPAEECEKLKEGNNVPNLILFETGQKIAAIAEKENVDSIRLQMLENTMTAISHAQGGMEKIKSTPLPYQYTIFPMLFIEFFCVVLPISAVDTLGIATPLATTIVGFLLFILCRLGRDLQSPFFRQSPNCLQLDSISEMIETDQLQCLTFNK